MGYFGRDVEAVFTGDRYMVVACDSCGAIGEMEHDVVHVSNYITGRFTARVAIFEVIATGATPKVLTATICNEPNPTGEALLKGVKDELKKAGMESVAICVSTEKNVPTKQTGLGITVIGLSDADRLRIAATRPGDDVYCLGIPKVGSEVNSPDDPEVIQAEHFETLLNDIAVHDIIPVGSKGILGEIQTLAEALGIEFLSRRTQWLTTLDIHKSGGPSTCALFTMEQGGELSLKSKNALHALSLVHLGSFK